METQNVKTNGKSTIMSLEPSPTVESKFSTKERETQPYSIRQTFGLALGYEKDKTGVEKLDAGGNKIPQDRLVTGFKEKTPWVPAVDTNYVFPLDETRIFLLGLESKDRILLTGGTGTGKTSLVEQIAARLNYNVVKINFDGAITRNDLIGEWVVKGKSMEFQYGILYHAFKMPGTIILLDEWDTISGECSFVLQRPLQKEDGKLLIMETGGELVNLHPLNTIVAAANTCGQGDDTGLYSSGTRIQNYSQLNRFNLTIRMEYPPPEVESDILKNKFPKLQNQEATIKVFVKAINELRKAHVNGEISVPLSTRDLINWVEKYFKLPDAHKAAKYCFLNRMSPEDALTAEGVIQRIISHEKKQ